MKNQYLEKEIMKFETINYCKVCLLNYQFYQKLVTLMENQGESEITTVLPLPRLKI